MADSIYRPKFVHLEHYYGQFFDEIQSLYKMRNDREAALAKLTNLYRYLKEITPDVYSEDEEEYKTYAAMINLILDAEERIFNNQITEYQPLFTYDRKHILDYELDHYSSPSHILDELVYATRKKLVSSWGRVKDLKALNLTNRCKLASKLTAKNAQTMGLKIQTIVIHPAYSEKSYIYHGSGYHYFNLITIEGKDYIVDCSYSQFFYLGRNNIERLGIVDLSGCFPGVYMLMSELGRKVSKEILEKGYIEATEENLKAYLDGFTLMYRNGLYYERLGEARYVADYTIDQYMNFLFGDDDQVQHEGEECLGYQRTPLENPHFKF